MTKSKQLESLKGKAATIKEQGAGPLVEGLKNYRLNDPDIEARAARRAETCTGCKHLVDEPIKSLRVNDPRLPALSGKMCGLCFCIAPYKVRQNLSPCEKWNE